MEQKAIIMICTNNSRVFIVRYLDQPADSYAGWSQPCYSREEAEKLDQEYNSKEK